MSNESTTTKTDWESIAQGMRTLSRSMQDALQIVANGFIKIGRIVESIGVQFTAILRRMYAIMLRRQAASQQFSGYTAVKLMQSLHANLGILYMPQTGNILGCFKRVTMRVPDTVSRGTHMFNPNQHLSISLIQDMIGRPGHVNRDELYECSVARYPETTFRLEPGRYWIGVDPSTPQRTAVGGDVWGTGYIYKAT